MLKFESFDDFISSYQDVSTMDHLQALEWGSKRDFLPYVAEIE